MAWSPNPNSSPACGSFSVASLSARTSLLPSQMRWPSARRAGWGGSGHGQLLLDMHQELAVGLALSQSWTPIYCRGMGTAEHLHCNGQHDKYHTTNYAGMRRCPIERLSEFKVFMRRRPSRICLHSTESVYIYIQTYMLRGIKRGTPAHLSRGRTRICFCPGFLQRKCRALNSAATKQIC